MENLGDVLTFLAIAGTLLSFIVAVRKAPSDIRQSTAVAAGTEATTAKTYMEAARLAAEQAIAAQRETIQKVLELSKCRENLGKVLRNQALLIRYIRLQNEEIAKLGGTPIDIDLTQFEGDQQ